MASYRDRFKAYVSRPGATLASVSIRDLSNALDDLDWLDKDNDELRLENERLLKALAELATQHAMFQASEPETEMCCGGTCVRAVCFIHGACNG